MRDIVSQGKGLINVGRAEVGKLLRGFRLYVLGLWLRRLIEGVGLLMMNTTVTAVGSWIRNCERRGGED